MRKELENIAQFDAYLLNELSQTDKLAFEANLIIDTKMAEDFKAYKDLMNAYERKMLSKTIQGEHARYLKFRLVKMIAIPILIIGVLGVAFASFTSNDSKSAIAQKYESSTLELELEEPSFSNSIDLSNTEAQKEEILSNNSTTENSPKSVKSRKAPIQFGGLDMWTNPDVSHFEIELEESNIVQTEEGTLILADKESFLLPNGDIAKGNIQLDVAEFLHLDQMILANLTTTSKGTQLQTDGMLHLEAKQDGELLSINPNKPLNISIPTDELKSNMLVFDGKFDPEKQEIDWVNPIKLSGDLIEMDLENLDFLPEGFENALIQNMPLFDQSNLDDNFVEETYYNLGRLADADTFAWSPSFAADYSWGGREFHFGLRGWSPLRSKRTLRSADTLYYNDGIKERLNYTFNKEFGSYLVMPKDTGVYNEEYLAFLQVNNWQTNEVKNARLEKLGVDPLAVKILKDSKFQGTWVATKEFEERLHILQKEENGQELLDTYCAHLDKNLYEVDEMILPKLKNEVGQAKLKMLADKKPTKIMSGKNADALSAYYNKQRAEVKEALSEMNNTLVSNPEQTKIKRKGKKLSILSSAVNRSQQNAINKRAYSFNWSGGSWINIDAYLHEIYSDDPVQTRVNVFDGANPNVYQYIGMLDNLTRLNSVNTDVYLATYPNRSLTSSFKEKNAMVLSISIQSDGNYRLGMKKFNPYEEDKVDLIYSVYSKDEFKAEMKKLRGSNNYMDKLEKDLRKKQRKIRQNQRLFNRINSDRMQINNARNFWKPLVVIVYLRSLFDDSINSSSGQTSTMNRRKG